MATKWAITPQDRGRRVEVKTLANTLGDLRTIALVNTLAEMLAQVRTETFGDILDDIRNEVHSEKFCDNFGC